MEVENYPYFKALFDSGLVILWHKPQTFTRVFKGFKRYSENTEGAGLLWCGDKLIRTTGNPEIVSYLKNKYAKEA